jgi:CMP-N-acetylneuraminic acid synthetase
MRVTAIIVARGGSQRVPGKALRPFGDSTLIGHKIEQLKQCKRITDIVVGSDCDDILLEASKHGASVRRRDAYHCDESKCSANEMIRNMVAMVETDVVVWAHPTNPLCMPDIYDSAVEKYLSLSSIKTPELMRDSLCSVSKVKRHAWGLDREPINFNPWAERHPLASELEPVFYQNGAIFIQPHRQMLENSYFYGKRPLLFEIAAPYDIDIDTERDLHIARAIDTAMRAEVSA